MSRDSGYGGLVPVPNIFASDAEHLFPKRLILTPVEVAVALRVDDRTVRRLLDEGQMTGFKVRGQWRVLRQSAVAYVTEGENGQCHE